VLENQGAPPGPEGLPQSHRRFLINGKSILIRGAGYTFDMLLRSSPEKQETDLKYVRDMNLNAVRLEGKIEDQHFFDLADEYGILIMAGWCCCDHWEKWQDWDDEDHVVAAASLRDQIRLIRAHASVFNWMNGSDGPPPPDVERMYISILKELNWPNPYESSATAKPTTVSGETGMKMAGPYEYVPPAYWLRDKQLGGAHGFATEISPGPAVPPLDSMRQMLPPEHLWPVDSWWDYHAGGGAFADIRVFTEALNQRYGKSSSAEEFTDKSQIAAYEAERAMFEGFGRNKYTSTGVIQWMLNNAWPSIIWHLYDYYNRPGGGYFGTKKACEPLHIQYSYDDRSIAIVNSYYQDFKGLKATATVYNLDLSEKFSKSATVDVAPDSVQRTFVIPEVDGLSTTYFLRLRLNDAAGKEVSSNFYWLSTKPETLDFPSSTWFYTPIKQYADLSGLAGLPKVELKVSQVSEIAGDEGRTQVTVENPGPGLAFGVHLKVSRPAKVRDLESDPPDAEILPVLWQDNYFPLFPGDKRVITATYRKADLGGQAPVVHIDGLNVAAR
jgi:exo-1,4-beta-D-glucosaminidase